MTIGVIGRNMLPAKPLTFGGNTVLERFESLVDDIQISDAKLRELMNIFKDEMELSFDVHKTRAHGAFDKSVCDFMALDTCVSKVPSGSEVGVCYGVDLGGSSIRVLRCELLGDGQLTKEFVKDDLCNCQCGLPKSLLDENATATMLFDYIAGKIKILVDKCGDTEKDIKVGFSFSFAADQLTLDRAIVSQLGKEFETGTNTPDPVLGVDIITLLNGALERAKIRGVCVGSVNDTTGTFLTACYLKGESKPSARLGLIVGTGFNICLMIDQSCRFGYQGSVINLECGGFSAPPTTIIDLDVCLANGTSMTQPCEKKVSGKYLCELARFALIRVFQSQAPQELWQEGAITTVECANVYNAYKMDKRTGRKAAKFLCSKFNWELKSWERDVVAKLICTVFERSAQLVALTIAACAERCGRLQSAYGGVTIGVDGSVFCLNPQYQEKVDSTLEMLLGPRAKMIYILPAGDSSGIGAAMLALGMGVA